MDATKILSIGHVAGQLQTPVSRLQELADLLKIVPRSTVNGIPYFDVLDVERIADRIRSEQAEDSA